MTLDPVSDMLTSIRNGQKARLHSVATPASNLKGEIARVMKEAGYIADAVTTNEFPMQGSIPTDVPIRTSLMRIRLSRLMATTVVLLVLLRCCSRATMVPSICYPPYPMPGQRAK